MRETLVDILSHSFSANSTQTAVVTNEGRKITYSELQMQALQVAAALQEHGVAKGDRVAIPIENVPGFLPANIGILYAGGISVLVNPETKPPEELRERLLFVRPKVILTLESRLEQIKRLVSGIPVLTLEETMNQTSTYCPVEVSPNDHAVYIFSSGTTGIKQIKAVMLTQENLASNILATDHVLDAIKGGICLSGVADNTHSFEHFLQLWILHNGMQLSYTDLAGFMRGEVAKIQPHYMIMIPKIANVIMDGIKRRFEEQGRLDLLEKALGYSAEYYRKALRGEPFSLKARFYHELANLTIYAKIRKGLREKFGKNLRLVVGGSAPLAPSTQEFFVAVGNHRLWIMQGYGLTETSPVVCVNTRQHYRIGSSGRVIPGVKVLIANTQKLSDCREIVEVKDGEEGELLINGPNVFAGYFDAPEKNQKAFVGGWFCTGDRAKIERVSDSSDLGPFLYITGRTKNLLVFGNGQKLAPEPIEAHYEAELAKTISRFVCVGGESIRELLHEDVEKFPLSVIVVPQEQVQQDILAGRIKEQEVIAKIQTGVRDSYQRFGFGIRGVVIDLNYNSAVDETPSRKLKRDAFLQSRVELVRRLYS